MRLSRRARRATVLAHVLVAIAWVGVDLAVGALSLTGLTTDDPGTMATAYTAIGLFAVPLMLALGLLTLATGVTLSLGTRYGLLRHWWVVAKLAANLTLTVLVVVALRPVLAEATAQAATVDPSLPARLARVRVDLVFPPVVSTTTLLAAAWLGWYKPRGATRPARRRRTAASSRRGDAPAAG